MPAGESLLAFAYQILQAELVRIHTEFACDGIYMRFRGEESLRLAGRAHLPAREIIRVDARNLDARVRGAIAAAGVSNTSHDRPWSESAVGAAVQIGVHLMGNDRPIPFDTGF